MLGRNNQIVLILIIIIGFIENSLEIIAPEDQEEIQKPNHQSRGIKTVNWKNPNRNIVLHHNYSRVIDQNSPNFHPQSAYEQHRDVQQQGNVQRQEKVQQQQFPIYYNAHTYGNRPQNEKLIIYRRKKEESEKPIEIYMECPQVATGQFVYELSCNQFLNCWKGRGYVQNCAPGTLFNPKTLECDFIYKVNCVTGPRKNTLDQYETISKSIIEQANCPKEFTGLIPNYTDCTKFLSCSNGLQYSMNCPNGTLFDIKRNVCDFDYKAQCFQNSKQNLIQTSNENNNNNNNCLKNCNKPKKIECPKNAAGLFKHPTDCSKFLNCANGLTYIQDCAPGTLFNENLKVCDFPYNVNCPKESESPEKTESEQEFDCSKCNQKPNYDQVVNILYHTQYGTATTPRNSIYAGNTNYYQLPISFNGENPTIIQQPTLQGYIPLNKWPNPSSTEQNPSPTEQNPIYNSKNPNYNRQNPNYNGQNPSYNNGQNSGYGGQNPSFNQQYPSYNEQHPSYNEQHPSYNEQNPSHNRQKPNYNKQNPNLQRPTIFNGQNPSYNEQNPSNNSENPSYNGQNPNYNQQQPNNNKQNPSSQRPPTFNGQNPNCDEQNPSCNGKYPVYNEQRPSTTFIDQNPSFNGQNSTYNGQNPIYNGQNSSFNGQNPSFNGQNPSFNEQNPTYNGQKPTYKWQNHNLHGNAENPSYAGQNPSHNVPNPNYNAQTPTHNTPTPNYSRPAIILGRNTTRKPFATKHPTQTVQLSNDYDDTFGQNYNNKYIQIVATTPKVAEKNWPPPFPSTDINADYVFEYEDTETVTLIAENSNDINNNNNKNNNNQIGQIEQNCAQKNIFYCTINQCIKKSLVCNGIKDCPNGKDELDCNKFLQKFQAYKNFRLAVLEKERWDNVTYSTCAILCLETQKFKCKSFNYRKIDKSCFLTNTNNGLTGALISYHPCDYYELISEQIDCTHSYKCPNRKCINKLQLCDGHDDCGDRTDEKNCQPKDFGYSIRLIDSEHKNEGNIEVTAFGRTGYICDDKFGLRDANVVCKELGFVLGAAEVKSNSYYAKNRTTNNNNNNNPFYMMDDVTCLGNETRLMDCDFSGWGVHNCLGQEVAGVVCKTPQEKCPKEYWQCDTGQECLPLAFVCDGLLDCTDGSDEGSQHCDAPTQIRLANGRVPNEGRIEIRHHDTWGTICDDDFNEDAAKVICKYLGYKGSALVKKDAYFGEGNGPIWLDQVFCSGNETNLEDCSHWNWGEHNCEHTEDVGVICGETNLPEIERHAAVIDLSANYPRECGYRKDNQFNLNDDVHFRVVSGSVARKGDYPWQAAIRVKGTTKAAHWCGAVIISELFVLTAAHCLIGYPKGAYIVVAGDYDIDEDEGTEQEVYIEDYYIHEGFRKGHKMNNDIALIKLKGYGFRLNPNIQPICLPDIDTDYERNHLNCTISGFGSVKSGQSGFSHQLRAGWIPIQTTNVCKMPHIYGTALTDGMICAGSLDEGIDSCDGDSGGPLACLDNGVFTLYGLTSWGQRCGYANKPGVYVKIAYYRRWLDKALEKYSKIK